MLLVTCGQCGYVADGLLDYENHRRAEERPMAVGSAIDWNAIAPARPQDARPVPEWVRRARLHELPASDRTAER